MKSLKGNKPLNNLISIKQTKQLGESQWNINRLCAIYTSKTENVPMHFGHNEIKNRNCKNKKSQRRQ